MKMSNPGGGGGIRQQIKLGGIAFRLGQVRNEKGLPTVRGDKRHGSETYDNLKPRQPTEIGEKKSAIVCDRDNSVSIRLCFLCHNDICP